MSFNISLGNQSNWSDRVDLTRHLLLIVWLLFSLVFYDRLVARLFARFVLSRATSDLLKLRRGSFKLKLTLSSASLRIFPPRFVCRNVCAAISNPIARSLVIEQLEVRLFHCDSKRRAALDRKLFRIVLKNPQLVLADLSPRNDDSREQQALSFVLKWSVLDCHNFSLLLIDSKNLTSFHLRSSRLGLVSRRGIKPDADFEEDSEAPLNPRGLGVGSSQIIELKSCAIRLEFCANFVKQPKTTRKIVTCAELRLKSSLSKRNREAHASRTLVDLKIKTIRLNMNSIEQLIRLFEVTFGTDFINSIVCKFHVNGFELSVPFKDNDEEMILGMRTMSLNGRASRDMITAKMNQTRIDSSFVFKLPLLECESIELKSSARSLDLEFNSVVVARRIVSLASLSRFIRLPVLPRNPSDWEFKFHANSGVLVDLAAACPVSTGRVALKVRSQSVDRSVRGLLLVERPKLTDSTRTIEITTERITAEMKTTTIDSAWQVITSPIRLGRYREDEKKPTRKVVKSDMTTTSSLDSYLYTYAIDEEEEEEEDDDDDDEFDHTTNLNDSSLNTSCWYVSVIQLRGEQLKNLGRTYSQRYELIIGDIFGTIELEYFESAFESICQAAVSIMEQPIDRPASTQSAPDLSSFRILSSMTHVNLLRRQSSSTATTTLINLIAAPLDYAQCHVHNTAVLPDINVSLLVSVADASAATTTSGGKYTGFVDCASICVKHSLVMFENSNDTTSSRARLLESRLLVEDRQTRRLEFLWTTTTTTTTSRQSCPCTCSHNQFFYTSKPYEFGNSFFTKACVYQNKFGESLLVNMEHAFYSHRVFFPEYNSSRRIAGTLHVVASLEESTSYSDSASSKSRFQPFEIYVYEDELNLFLNEQFHQREHQENKPSAIEVPHMTPPYFSSDFNLYVRFLPIVRNFTRCVSSTDENPRRIVWAARTTRLKSDVAARVTRDEQSRKSSNRKLSIWPKKHSLDESSAASRYKFSLSQFRPEFKLKPTKNVVSMLSDKRLRVEEVFVESVLDVSRVRDDENDQNTSADSMSVELPDFPRAKHVLFLSLIEIRIEPCLKLIEIFQPKENDAFENRFYLKKKKFPKSVTSTIVCVNRLNACESDAQFVEARNIVVNLDRLFLSVEKSIKIDQLSIDLDNRGVSVITSLLNSSNRQLKLVNDHLIDLVVAELRISCPDLVLSTNFRVDFAYDRADNNLEVRSKLNCAKSVELTKKSLCQLARVIEDIIDTIFVANLIKQVNYNIELNVDNFEARLDMVKSVFSFKIDSSFLHASNRFEVSSCRFKASTSGRVESVVSPGTTQYGLEFRLEKNVLDARVHVRVRSGGANAPQRKCHITLDLPVFSQFEFVSKRAVRIGRATLTLANHSELNRALLIELTDSVIDLETSNGLSIESQLVRAVQCSELYDLLGFESFFHHELIDEFRARFFTRHLVWSIFAGELSYQTSWLYLNLFNFQVEYSSKQPQDITKNVLQEQLRIEIKENSPEEDKDDRDEKFAPKRNVCLWVECGEKLYSTCGRMTATMMNESTRGIIDYACMQTQRVYSVRPLVRASDSGLEISLTFETNHQSRVSWHYQINNNDNLLLIDPSTAELVWNKLVLECLWKRDDRVRKRDKMFDLIAKDASSSTTCRVRRWNNNEDSIVVDLRFLDAEKLGVVLKERNLFFSFFSSLSSLAGSFK